MITTQRVWISPQAYERLQQELATLRRLSAAGGALNGDTDENAAAVQRGWWNRIQQIHDLLVTAVVGEDPPDDGIAEPGMVVTIRYDDTGDIETFLLGGIRGAPSTATWRSTQCSRRWALQSQVRARVSDATTNCPAVQYFPSPFSGPCPTACTPRKDTNMPKVDESIWLQRWESEGGGVATWWTGAAGNWNPTLSD